MKRMPQVLGYSALFLVSFLFFLYLMFPYNVLKESMLNKVNQATGLDISAAEMSPAFLIGGKLSKVLIKVVGGQKGISLQKVKLTLNPFYILAGKINVSLTIEKKSEETIEASVSIPIYSLVKGQINISSLTLNAKSFPLQDSIAFLFDKLGRSGGNPLLTSLFNEISIDGNLFSNFNLSFNVDQVDKSNGNAILEIKSGALKFTKSDFGIQDQKFSKAKISASVQGGKLQLDKSSGFVTDDLEIGFDGKIALANNIGASQSDVVISVKLLKQLKEKFGFLVDGLTQKTTGGELSVQMRGPLANMSITTI